MANKYMYMCGCHNTSNDSLIYKLYPIGFSFGGILANLCATHLWSLSQGICPELLEKNLLCITFGQPIISLPRTTDKVADKRRFHAIYISDDIIPRMMRYLDPGYTEFTAEHLLERFRRENNPNEVYSFVTVHELHVILCSS